MTHFEFDNICYRNFNVYSFSIGILHKQINLFFDKIFVIGIHPKMIKSIFDKKNHYRNIDFKFAPEINTLGYRVFNQLTGEIFFNL